MRKFLTAIMAVLMMASAFAMLPTGAATATTYDKTTSSNVPKGLVVTEYVCDTTSETTGRESDDAFTYIEIYNRGWQVSLYSYCLLRGANTNSDSIWRSSHGFEKQMYLTANEIYKASHVDGSLWGKNEGSPSTTQSDFQKYYNLKNPSTANLSQGKLAVVWFYTEATFQCAQKEGRALTFDDFKEHWKKKGHTIPSDTLIVAVCAKGGKSFELRKDLTDQMYAIAKNDFSLTSDVAYSQADGVSNKVISLWDYGLTNTVGIPVDNSWEDRATLYVPANAKPELYNAIEKANDSKYVDANNYIDIGYATSYKEMAVINFNQKATPGSMPAFQWVYVDANRAPSSITGTSNWKTKAVQDLLDAEVVVSQEAQTKEEVEQKIDLPDRSTLGNLGQNVQKTNKKGGGLSPVMLILIIVGGVLLVGGIVVVLILVFKKKGKMQQADDDVATEGEVEIVDETDE